MQGKGGIYYKTTSPVLATGIVELVNSLGGIAIPRKIDGSKYKLRDGTEKQGRALWDISIRINGGWCPFTLERKKRFWSNDRRGIRRNIVDIQRIGEAPCTCISVAASDGLFVTKDFIVTHNSQSIRTHSKALTFTQMEKDQSWLRPGLPDYILKFRKPGDNPIPVVGQITRDEWIDFADPTWPSDSDRALEWGAWSTWYGIKETDTLNTYESKEEQDEKHICPLQLGTIERCVRLWSNPGETILDPFSGIASTGVRSIELGRKYIGCELKTGWYSVGVNNLNTAVESLTPKQADMFGGEQC
jgi:hypothetical protein